MDSSDGLSRYSSHPHRQHQRPHRKCSLKHQRPGTTNAKAVADAVRHVVASRAQTARQRVVTKVRAGVVGVAAVKVVAMDALQDVVVVAAAVTARHRVHVSVLIPTVNPSTPKQQATCRQ